MSELHSPSIDESAQIIVDDRSKGRRDWFGATKRCRFHSLWSRRLFRSSSTIDLEKKDKWTSLTFDRQHCSDYGRRGIKKTKKFNLGKSSEFLSVAIAKLVHIILDARTRKRKHEFREAEVNSTHHRSTSVRIIAVDWSRERKREIHLEREQKI